MQRYDQATVVIKYGGHAMGDAKLAEGFARDVVMLEQASVKPVVVHGGGPQIARLLDRLGIVSEFSGGLRVTDAATVEVVEMVLAGTINKQIVNQINQLGGHACGISGKDGNLMIARKLTRTERDPDSNIERAIDLGFVGDPEEVNPRIVQVLAANEIIPVVAPLGFARDGTTYNINADTFASALAASLKAKRLLLLTDVAGVLDRDKKLIHHLSVSQAKAMIADGTITGGMIPKVEGCIGVIEQGVEGVVILDGRVPHAVLLELFTEHGVGTLIER
ncbi:MAG: acetylglutamate kinase, partial [Rhodomicrobium sp.]